MEKIKLINSNLDLNYHPGKCHLKIKKLTKLEENLKDQVIVTQVLCIERKQVIKEREKALAELKAEKVTAKDGVRP